MITLPLAAALWAPAPQAATPQLNELYITYEGTTANQEYKEFIELVGSPGLSLDGMMLLVVDGRGSHAGLLEQAIDLSGHVLPPDGYFVMGSGFGGSATVDLILGSFGLFSNWTQTFYLVQAPDTAAIEALVGTNVDGDGDGVTDLVTLSTILDHVAIVDDPYPIGIDRVFDGAQALGPRGTQVPAGIFRSGDAPGAWCHLYLDADSEFNIDHPRTRGMPNRVCSTSEIVIEEGKPDEWFGSSLRAEGNHVLVSATGHGPDGAVFQYDTDLNLVRRLLPQPTLGSQIFGGSMDIDGDLALISASELQTNGGAYLFDLNTGAELMYLQVPSNVRTAHTSGGLAVLANLTTGYTLDLATGGIVATFTMDPYPGGIELVGTTLYVGLPFDNQAGFRAGAVRRVDILTGADLGNLHASDAATRDSFGLALATHGQTLAVATRAGGSVYLIDGATGTELEKFTPANPPPLNAVAGTVVALDDELLLLFKKLEGVLVIDRSSGFELLSWAPESEHHVDVVGQASVAVSPMRLLAGCPTDSERGDNSGSTHLLERSVGTGLCTSSANSTGQPAVQRALGSSSIDAGNLLLYATSVPPSQPGLHFYGPNPVFVPFGNGTRCVGAPVTRLPVGNSGSKGLLVQELDRPTLLASPITPGSTWYFQAWFRDPVGGGSFFDLSDSRGILFRP